MWKFCVETSEWTQLRQATNTALDASHSIESSTHNAATCASDHPCPRSGQSTIYDPVHKRIILFGGRKNKKADGDLNDLWEFDIEQGVWSQGEDQLALSGGKDPMKPFFSMSKELTSSKILVKQGSNSIEGGVTPKKQTRVLDSFDEAKGGLKPPNNMIVETGDTEEEVSETQHSSCFVRAHAKEKK